jgi:hypothetical protein
MTRIKKVIHDKLITDMRALTFYNSNKCFADVQKMFVDFPTGTPFCEVYATQPTINIDGLGFDSRSYGFAFIVGDYISKETSQTQIDLQIDRMSDVEDSILDYLEKKNARLLLLDSFEEVVKHIDYYHRFRLYFDL